MIVDVAAVCVSPQGPYPSRVHHWWDRARDVRTYDMDLPVVAHPPCGPWGRLWAQCNRQDAALGPICVDIVRRCGGILEHPAHSLLFGHRNMPPPGGLPDAWGGWTFATNLCRFGAPVNKPTWLYMVGIEPWPEQPPPGPVTRTVDQLWSDARQLTPPAMADWLLRVAKEAGKEQHHEAHTGNQG